jgi:hypothetical protein
MNKKPSHDPACTLLLADFLPNGSGGFIITPKQPTREISSQQTAKMLNVSRSTLSNLLNEPKAYRILRWRWISGKMGKRVFDLESVLQYRKATRDPEFGGTRPGRRSRTK